MVTGGPVTIVLLSKVSFRPVKLTKLVICILHPSSVSTHARCFHTACFFPGVKEAVVRYIHRYYCYITFNGLLFDISIGIIAILLSMDCCSIYL